VEIDMAYLLLDSHRSTPMAVARKPGPGLLGRTLYALRLWRERVRERDALTRLTDRDLQDMRVSRYDLETEIRKPFWRD
jgi:uncharacterized protein YjiS (DUF1127 family)